VAIVSRLDVVSRRLKDVLDAVEVGVVNLVYRECKQVVATTKRRLHCDIRRVNDAVSRALDDRRDVEAVAREIAKGAVLHPLSHSSFTREQGLHIDISAEAEIELKKVGASDKLTEAIKRIGADPLCREADRLTLDHHELYRLAVVLNQVDQTALVYEVIRIPTESPFAAVDDPLSIARIVLWRVRTV
jgi:LmbE family N-acetylglucosaminyl deacetylase